MQLERRPLPGGAYVDSDGYVQFARPGEEPRRKWRFEETAEGRRIAKAARQFNHARLKRRLERAKAGLPSTPPAPKSLTREQRLNQLYRSLDAMREAYPQMEGAYARRVMVGDIKRTLADIKALEAGKEPERRGRRAIEKEAIR